MYALVTYHSDEPGRHKVTGSITDRDYGLHADRSRMRVLAPDAAAEPDRFRGANVSKKSLGCGPNFTCCRYLGEKQHVEIGSNYYGELEPGRVRCIHSGDLPNPLFEVIVIE